MNAALAPDTAARAEDEIRLAWLSLWDQGEPASIIAAKFAATRNAVLAFVWRVHQADPEALARKPQPLKSWRNGP